jgi:Gas vesicle protein
MSSSAPWGVTAAAGGGSYEQKLQLGERITAVVQQREAADADRLLAGGVVIAENLTLRIADVDLVRIDLNTLVSSVNAQVPSPWEEPA